MKAKAAELRVREEIKAERRREKRRQQIADIVLREDSDEDSDEGSEEDIKTSQGRDWNTCLSLCCFSSCLQSALVPIPINKAS